jgi:hypothetical protein
MASSMPLHMVWELPKNSRGVRQATIRHGIATGAQRRSSIVSRNATSIVTKSSPRVTSMLMPTAPSQWPSSRCSGKLHRGHRSRTWKKLSNTSLLPHSGH